MASPVVRVGMRGARDHLPRVAMTLVGISIAIAFVCSTLIIAETMHRSFDDAFTEAYGEVDVFVRGRYGAANSFGAAIGGAHSSVSGGLVDQLSSVDGTQGVVGQVQEATSIIGADGEPSKTNGMPTFGMNWQDDPEFNGWTLVSGSVPSGSTDAVVDLITAQALSLELGSTFRVVQHDGRLQALTLVGIGSFGETVSFAGSAAVLTTTRTAQQTFLAPEQFSWIAVKASPGTTQGDLQGRIAAALPKEAKAVTGARFTKDAQDTFGALMGLVQRFVLAFAYVALFISAYSIFNTFSIVIAQRRRELALLRAIGASRRQLVFMVLIEAVIVGFAAAALGAALGVGAAFGVRSLLVRLGFVLQVTPVQIPVGTLASVIILGIVLTAATALFPAWRAARARAVESLRMVAEDDVSRPLMRLIAGAGFILFGSMQVFGGLRAVGTDRIAGVAAGISASFIGVAVLGPLLWRRAVAVVSAPMARHAGMPARLARANVSRHPSRTARIGASLVIGVGLLAMFSVMATSLAGASAAEYEQTVHADLIVHPELTRGGVVDADAISAIRAEPAVETVSGVHLGYGEANDMSAAAIGVDWSTIGSVFPVSVLEGSVDNMGATDIAIDSTSAERHGWHVGSQIKGEFVQTGYETLNIAAVLDIEVPFGAAVNMFMTPAALDSRVPPPQRGAAVVFVRLRSGTDPLAARVALSRAVADRPFLRVETTGEYARARALLGESFLNVVTALLLIALVVSFVSIANTLLLSVHERTHEIGVLRAVGMLRSEIAAMVRWEAIAVAVVGAAGGLVLGLGFGWALTAAASSGDAVHPLVPWVRLLASALTAIGMAVLAASYPARRAAGLDILRAINTP